MLLISNVELVDIVFDATKSDNPTVAMESMVDDTEGSPTPCKQSPVDLEAISLTTRPSCLQGFTHKYRYCFVQTPDEPMYAPGGRCQI